MDTAVLHRITQKLQKQGTFFCAVLVLVSLLLHTINTNHTHPVHSEHSHSKSEAGEVLSEYMHMGEKKFPFSLQSIFSFPLSLPPTLTLIIAMLLFLARIWFRPTLIFSIFWQHNLFKTGILNPKPY